MNILCQEEKNGRQRAKTHWLKVRDSNTSYFHKFANGRLRSNEINYIFHNGTEIVSQEGLNNIFTEHYRHIFGTFEEHRIGLNWKDLFLMKGGMMKH